MLVWRCHRHNCEVRMNWFGEFHVTAGRVRFGIWNIICVDCETDDNPAPTFRDDDK